MNDPAYNYVRDCYANATADDMYWHHKDYLADLEKQKAIFDAWFEEKMRQKQEEAYDRAVKSFFVGGDVELMLTTNPYRKVS